MNPNDLTPDEMELVETYRAGKRLKEAADQPENQPGYSQPPAFICQRSKPASLSEAEKLALHLIGQLALNNHLDAELLDDSGGQGLYWLFETITEALLSGLKAVDVVALERPVSP